MLYTQSFMRITIKIERGNCRMKKIITLLIAGVLSLSLCSCGSETPAPDAGNNVTSQEKTEDVSTDVKEDKDAEKAEDDTTSSETKTTEE